MGIFDFKNAILLFRVVKFSGNMGTLIVLFCAFEEEITFHRVSSMD
jgi:hypothetical protein